MNPIHFNHPFPHVVVDDFFPPQLLRAVALAWPDPSWHGWYVYANERQYKRASDLVSPLHGYLAETLHLLAMLDVGRWLSLEHTVADLSLYGAGLHELPPGGFVARHLDASHHARLGLARAWSAALYVHEQWEPHWGGALELLSDAEPVVVPPLPGRLVVFACGNSSWHAVGPVACPPGFSRRSLSLFGYGPPGGSVTRPRAQFEEER